MMRVPLRRVIVPPGQGLTAAAKVALGGTQTGAESMTATKFALATVASMLACWSDVALGEIDCNKRGPHRLSERGP